MATKYFFEKKATSGQYLWSDDDSGGGANSNWSSTASPSYTATTKPANQDTVIITTGTTCTYDVDMSSGWTNGCILTINGTLRASESAGNYNFRSYAQDITLAGTLQAGTSTVSPYPATCTFTIDFNNAAKSIERGANGSIQLFCTQPANTYAYTTATMTGGATTEVTLDRNLSADGPWAISGAQVRIVDSTPLDSEIRTLASTPASDHIHVTAAITNNKSTGSMICLVTRNVRIINVAASDYAITYAAGAGSGDYIGAELNTVYRGINGGTSITFAGTCELLTTSPVVLFSSNSAFFSGTACGPTSGTSYVLNSAFGVTTTSGSVIAGFVYGTGTNFAITFNGLIFGCTRASNGDTASIVTSSAAIKYNSIGFYGPSSIIAYSSFVGNGSDIYFGSNVRIANTSLSGTTTALESVESAQLYNVAITSGLEFRNYTTAQRSIAGYAESFNHDQEANAFKAWCRGGIVTSSTTSPPTGYTIWYAHACESATYPCFRQWQYTVAPDETLIVTGKMRIPAATDMSSDPPKFQVIDYFADLLVDSTKSPLATMSIPVSNGTVTTWQDMSIAYTNTAASPKLVLIRTTATHATQQVDECVYVPDINAQVSTIYTKLPSKDYLTGTANSDGDVEMDDATGNYPGTVGKSAMSLATGDVTGNLPADIKAYTVQPTVTGATLDAAYDAAKTAVQAGDEMLLTSAYDAAKTAMTLASSVDGLTAESVLECLLAFMAGKASVVDNGTTRTISFYKQNGTTVKLALTAAEADGSRAAGGTIA